MSENTRAADHAAGRNVREFVVWLAPPTARRTVVAVGIPFDKPYRAFRELDALSDRQCRRFVALAARRHRVSMTFAIIGGLAATAGGWAVVAGAWRLLGAQLPAIEARLEQREMGPASWIILMALCIGVGPLCGLVVRDRWLRWAIRDTIDRTRCARCGRARMSPGPSVDGSLTCAACGEPTTSDGLAVTGVEVLPAG